jgi:hypothetical protein
MQRSYSELQHADDTAAAALRPYGLGRPTMSRAGWSPVGGENGGHVEMAASLIFTRMLNMISNRSGGNARSTEKPPLPNFRGYFADMKASDR